MVETTELGTAEVSKVDWKKLAENFQEENLHLKEVVKTQESLLQKAMAARVTKQDKGSWMNLSFAVNIKEFGKKVLNSVV